MESSSSKKGMVYDAAPEGTDVAYFYGIIKQLYKLQEFMREGLNVLDDSQNNAVKAFIIMGVAQKILDGGHISILYSAYWDCVYRMYPEIEGQNYRVDLELDKLLPEEAK